MSYQVIARRWRPQDFKEVVFQDHISETIKNSIINNRITHAYLFSGPRGVGKTTMARILAKALNCVEGPTPEPCGVCENCVEIKNGTSFDVIEIDGASNNGVDDIRELRENVNFSPIKSKYKIYIIDEVHMVTNQAFNALLKTLEEPPPHVIFIFATTEFHKIPETILSRCQKYFFKKIPLPMVIEHLKKIAEQDGFSISDSALYPIARAGEGSMRDSQSLLEQVLSFAQKDGGVEISEHDALSILGIVSVDSYISLLKNIQNLQTLEVILEVERVISLGVDIVRYVAGFVDIVRSLRLVRNGVSLEELLSLSSDETTALIQISNGFEDEEIGGFFRILATLQSDLKFADSERVYFEMALLDMITLKQQPSISKIIRKLENESSQISSDANNSLSPTNQKEQKFIPSTENEKENLKKKNDITVSNIDINKVWGDFLISIKMKKSYLHFKLAPIQIKFEDNCLYLSYPSGKGHDYYGKILDSDSIDFIKEEISNRIGIQIQLRVEKNEVQNENNFEFSKNEKQNDISEAPLPDDSYFKKPKNEIVKESHPMVEIVKKVFHGEIVENKQGEL